MQTIVYKGSRVWLIKPHPLYREHNLRVNWDTLLPPLSGTRHQRAYLLRSAKDFLFESVKRSEARVGALSPGTVRNRFIRIRVLCRWMIEREIWRFNQLKEPDLLNFLEDRLASSRSNRSGSVAVTSSSFGGYYELLEELYGLRDEYPAPLRVDLAVNADSQELIARASPVKCWPSVELPVAKELLRWTISVVERSKYVEQAASEISLAAKSWVGLTGWKRNRECRRLLDRINSGYQANSALFSVDDTFQESIRTLVGSILIIILFFTGMRISEVLTLQIDCLVQRLHADGSQHWYLQGSGAKRKGRERLWVVPEIVVNVVRSQIRLFASVRELFGVKMLFISKFETMRMLTGRFKPKPMGGARANALMREVIKKSGGSSTELSNEFHAHRARKTFARFVVLRDKSALESLAHHYGHLYAAVLDRHYVGNDFRLEELIREEDREELRAGLTKLLTSAKIGGKAGERITSVRETMLTSKSSNMRGKLTLDSVVDKLVTSGLILAPCDWGYCVYARELSKCQGNSNGPNPIKRAPSVCSSCANFAVVEHHLPWWERRHSEQSKFLNRSDLPDQTRRIVTEQLLMTERVLSSIVTLRMKENKND